MGIEVRSVRSAELGNAAHVVVEQDSGVAVVIDPVRDVEQYMAVDAGEHAELAWALETHVHNDFVSGARELVGTARTSDPLARARRSRRFVIQALTAGTYERSGYHQILVVDDGWDGWTVLDHDQ